jgi:hypothetical protein
MSIFEQMLAIVDASAVLAKPAGNEKVTEARMVTLRPTKGKTRNRSRISK